MAAAPTDSTCHPGGDAKANVTENLKTAFSQSRPFSFSFLGREEKKEEEEESRKEDTRQASLFR